MFATVKKIIKPFIPEKVLAARLQYLRKNELIAHDAAFGKKEPKDIFSVVYADAMWGKAEDDSAFCSGHGSHLPAHVSPYVAAVSGFLNSIHPRLNVVDLGCGDFNVGSQIRPYAANYTACDIVPDLVEYNRTRFSTSDVDFRVVDIIADELPPGDIVIIRQVLQHLSNAHILQVLAKLHQYKFLILTEFIPEGDFSPNLDQPTGAFSRLARGIPSGIVLTEMPFNLKVQTERVICKTAEPGGWLTVTVYEL